MLAVGGTGLAYMPHTIRVVTDFDKLARQIKVTATHSDGREESISAGFDDVRTLQLYQHRAKATQTQTLTLILRDGRTAFLGEERQRSDFFQPPFHDGLADTIRRIREETGVGEVEDLPLPVQLAGRGIGAVRR